MSRGAAPHSSKSHTTTHDPNAPYIHIELLLEALNEVDCRIKVHFWWDGGDSPLINDAMREEVATKDTEEHRDEDECTHQQDNAEHHGDATQDNATQTIHTFDSRPPRHTRTSSNHSALSTSSSLSSSTLSTSHTQWNLPQQTYLSYLSLLPAYFHRHLLSKANLRLFIKRNSLPCELRPIIYQFLCQLRSPIDASVASHHASLYDKLWTQPDFEATEKRIRKDLNRTFPEFPLFKTPEGQEELFRILKSYGVMDRIVGYTQGMAFIGGFLLWMFHRGMDSKVVEERVCANGTRRTRANSTGTTRDAASFEPSEDLTNVAEEDEEDTTTTTSSTTSRRKRKPSLTIDTSSPIESSSPRSPPSATRKQVECTTFWVFTSLMNNPKWNAKSLFVPGLPKLFEVLFCIERAIEKKAPRVAEWIRSQGINSEVYAAQFVMTLCTNHFQSEVTERIWDLVFLDGWCWIIRLVAAIMIENEGAITRLKDCADFIPLVYANCSKYTPEHVVLMMERVALSEDEINGFTTMYEARLSKDEQDKKRRQRAFMQQFMRKNSHLISEGLGDDSGEDTMSMSSVGRRSSIGSTRSMDSRESESGGSSALQTLRKTSSGITRGIRNLLFPPT